jgi:DNA invertase Pin-like site-specific DNA recombinase
MFVRVGKVTQRGADGCSRPRRALAFGDSRFDQRNDRRMRAWPRRLSEPLGVTGDRLPAPYRIEFNAPIMLDMAPLFLYLRREEQQGITEMSNKALAYYRTSSATNVGEDKDSRARQENAVRTYAATHGIEIVEAFYDVAVRGADMIDARPGFTAMLTAIAGNGVRTIIVETANRFARDLIVQETGYRFLQARGIELIAADSPTMFLDDTPTATLIRQILGSVAQFEKAALVSRLSAARKRLGKPGGKTPLATTRPDVAERVTALRSAEPTITLRAISATLEAEGFVTPNGKAYGPSAIARLLAR